jgi:UDP-N-acetylglucosamine 4-epimerase
MVELCNIASKIPQNSQFMVTGGAGFIGSNLCESLLNLGYRVKCLDNLSNGNINNIAAIQDNPAFTFRIGDIRDYDTCLEMCRDADYVLHQAAWGSVPRSIEEPVLYEEINIKGTLNMMEAARQSGVKRFVYASSSSVYGSSTQLPKQEGFEGEVLSPYALTKKVNEYYGRLYKNLYGLNTFGLRYFNVFGKHQNPNGAYSAVIPRFVRQVLSGETPVIYGDGKQSRDFTYIDNVILGNLCAVAADDTNGGEVYNIAFGGREYLLDVYYLICELLGKTIEPDFAESRKGDIAHSSADISKARECLNFTPAVDFKTGLLRTINYYKELFV